MTLNPSVVSVTKVGAGTLTAANLLTTNILRSGPVGAFADTLDTAANIATAAFVGASWVVRYVNNSSSTGTLTAGTGVTLAGASAAIPANSLAVLLVTVVSPTAVTVTVIYRSSVT
jgi:hypothetical protein